MYLNNIKLWNFRKYGRVGEFDLDKPHLQVPFTKGLNLLIGENDSGKSAIIDAIKLVLKTHAYEWIKVEKDDFFETTNSLRIELEFKSLTDVEASHFTEWLGWEGEGDKATPILRLIYHVEKKNDRILPADICAGMDEMGISLNATAREFLKTTYLKALRDADSELIARRNSRISQILQGHTLFKNQKEEHSLVEKFKTANKDVQEWFEDDQGEKSNKKQIKDVIDEYLKAFIGDEYQSKFDISNTDINSILEKISIIIDNNKNLGLGTQNRLYMALELLHLKKEWDGARLCLIEELEAHLHPQAQMKVIEKLLIEKDVQFILTTHSPNLASKVPLKSLIICKDSDVYPLGEKYTELNPKDYKYLERFLDVTKSNLFFAKGLIFVEGWAEEILIPELAKKIGCDLTKHEVSIVNVGSTAYLHFAKIFMRKDGKKINYPVAIVTDLDIRPKNDLGEFDQVLQMKKEVSINNNCGNITGTSLKLFIAKEWTLEWCLYKSEKLSELFKLSVSKIHSRTSTFKKTKEVWDIGFQKTLIDKLKKAKGDSPLDKVAVANELSQLLSDSALIIDESDAYIDYLIEAIKYACRK